MPLPWNVFVRSMRMGYRGPQESFMNEMEARRGLPSRPAALVAFDEEELLLLQCSSFILAHTCVPAGTVVPKSRTMNEVPSPDCVQSLVPALSPQMVELDVLSSHPPEELKT